MCLDLLALTFLFFVKSPLPSKAPPPFLFLCARRPSLRGGVAPRALFFLEAEAEAFLVLAALNARKAFFDVAPSNLASRSSFLTDLTPWVTFRDRLGFVLVLVSSSESAYSSASEVPRLTLAA